MGKASDAFRTISEVADELGVPKHVLRFWESKFSQIRPMKRGGGRRFYRPEDMDLLRAIRDLLHRDGYTIKGVQRILREQGVDVVKQRGRVPSPVASAKPPRAVRGRTGRGTGADSAAPGGAKASALVAEAQNAPRDLRKRILAAIAELEACKALLAEEAGQTRSARGRGAAR